MRLRCNLDGLHSHKKRLGDLLIAQILGGELRDARLTCGQRIDASKEDRSAVRSGRSELVVRACGQRVRASPLREFDRLPEMDARLEPLPRVERRLSYRLTREGDTLVEKALTRI